VQKWRVSQRFPQRCGESATNKLEVMELPAPGNGEHVPKDSQALHGGSPAEPDAAAGCCTGGSQTSRHSHSRHRALLCRTSFVVVVAVADTFSELFWRCSLYWSGGKIRRCLKEGLHRMVPGNARQKEVSFLHKKKNFLVRVLLLIPTLSGTATDSEIKRVFYKLQPYDLQFGTFNLSQLQQSIQASL